MQLIVAVFLENFEKDVHVAFEQQKRGVLARINRAKAQGSVFGQVLNLAKVLPRLRRGPATPPLAALRCTPPQCQ